MLGRNTRRLRENMFRTVVLISIYCEEPHNVYELAYVVHVTYVVDVKYVRLTKDKPLSHSALTSD